MLFPILLIMGILYGVYETLDVSTMFKIERSTIQREALPAEKCKAIDKWFQDDWGDWINEKYEDESLQYGLEYFYKKTGVQPYLWIMGEEGKDYMSEGSIEELAEETYKEMFGDDEGHVLVVFREYPNASSKIRQERYCLTISTITILKKALTRGNSSRGHSRARLTAS